MLKGGEERACRDSRHPASHILLSVLLESLWLLGRNALWKIVIDDPSPKRAVWVKCLGCCVSVTDLTDKRGCCQGAGFPGLRWWNTGSRSRRPLGRASEGKSLRGSRVSRPDVFGKGRATGAATPWSILMREDGEEAKGCQWRICLLLWCGSAWHQQLTRPWSQSSSGPRLRTGKINKGKKIHKSKQNNGTDWLAGPFLKQRCTRVLSQTACDLTSTDGSGTSYVTWARRHHGWRRLEGRPGAAESVCRDSLYALNIKARPAVDVPGIVCGTVCVCVEWRRGKNKYDIHNVTVMQKD